MSPVGLMRQADALEQAEQIELALRAQFVEYLFGREIVDADDHALAQGAEGPGQSLENLVRHGLHFGERGRFGCGPHGGSFSASSWGAHADFEAVDLSAAIGDPAARKQGF